MRWHPVRRFADLAAISPIQPCQTDCASRRTGLVLTSNPISSQFATTTAPTIPTERRPHAEAHAEDGHASSAKPASGFSPCRRRHQATRSNFSPFEPGQMLRRRANHDAAMEPNQLLKMDSIERSSPAQAPNYIPSDIRYSSLAAAREQRGPPSATARTLGLFRGRRSGATDRCCKDRCSGDLLTWFHPVLN
jgi:hypothetical protein